MSIGTASMYETLLMHDRPIAWWGLDSDDATVDDSGNGWTLTAGTAPVSAATLITHGDTGLSGSRDFNGTTHSYFTAGSQLAVADGPPAFHSSASGTAQSTTTATLVTPAEIVTGDLMIAVLVHSVNTATISTAPAGWTQIGSTVNDTQAATAAYRKTAGAADERQAEAQWIWSTTGSLCYAIFVYRGCDPAVANLVYDSSVTALSTSEMVKTSPSETFPDQSRFLVVWTGDATSGLTVTPDPNFVNERVTLQTSDNVFLEAVDYVEETAGSRTRHANFSFADQAAVVVVTFGSPRQTVNGALDAIDEHLSVHAVVRPDTVSGVDTIVMKRQAWGVVLNAGVVEFRYRDGGGVDRTVTGPTLSASTTYHLVVTDDGTNIHFYRNGVETTAARTGTAGYTTNAESVLIGATWNGASYQDFFDGKIDEVALWGITVSDDMVATWYTGYNAGTFGTTHTANQRYSPRLMLEVAWTSAPSDDSFVWQNMTDYGRAAAVTRGRNFELDRMETGRMDFDLSCLNGEFLPDNTASIFYPYVIPTRAVRLRAQAVTDGPVYPLFFGYTEGHPVVRPGSGFDAIARFTAADPMKALSLDKVLEQSVRETELSGARISAVLEGIAGIPYNADAGKSEVVGDDLQGLNRLDHVQTVAATDGGVVFADGAGVIQFQDRHYRILNEATSRYTYGNGGGSELPFTMLEPEIDEARLFTTAAITPASGITKTAENDEAVRQHFRRTKDLQTLHVLDNDAQAMAEAFVERYSTPRTFVPGFDVRPKSAAGWTAALSHELSHRISTIDRPLGAASVTREHFIERIEHSITTGDWRVKIGVSPGELESGFWILDVGELGDTTGRTSTRLGW